MAPKTKEEKQLDEQLDKEAWEALSESQRAEFEHLKKHKSLPGREPWQHNVGFGEIDQDAETAGLPRGILHWKRR